MIGMFGLGGTELIWFMVIVIVIFGSSRLPSLMRNLGRSANEFKAGMKDPVSEDAPADDAEDDKEDK
ncbi:MAG: twin-arginine translocase TatA/TatE family subunit [Pirellulaceae bacterium]